MDRMRTLNNEFAARVPGVFGTRSTLLNQWLRMMTTCRVCLVFLLDENFKRRLGAEADPNILSHLAPLSRENDRQCEIALQELGEIFDAG